MTIEIKQDVDGRHWLVVIDGESIGGFKSKEDAERFINPVNHKDAWRVREGLKKAFKELRRRGYFARANFWCCQSCGLAAIPDAKARKYVFYHAQDNDSINERGICHLSWAGDPDEIKFICEQVGGLKVTWDGNANKRIEITASPLN
jgi:hypothetical protein